VTALAAAMTTATVRLGNEPPSAPPDYRKESDRMSQTSATPPGLHAGDNQPATRPRLPSGQNAVVWTLWLTYGAFYFCRTNISSAVPGMKTSLADGGLGLSGDEVGWILASLKIAYGIGQLLNGQISERASPRVMLAIGMFGSAALNVMFGLGTGFFFLLFVWASNGFCQSLGWTPCMRVAANWVPVQRRGRAIGIIGTGYQITLGLTYLIAAQSAQHLGWRGALYVPAVLLAATGVFMLVFLREKPDDSELEEHAARPVAAPRCSLRESLYWTLYNPTLWLLGLALGLLNACRYGFVDWGVTHLMEVREIRVGKAGLNFFVIAIGATAGSYLAGWATDRFFGSRRAPVICVLMALLGVLSLIYDPVVRSSTVGTLGMLIVIGFCIYGPQVLLVGTAPADLAHRGTSAAAAGFVNFMGYMGAATGDVITGYYSSPEHGGWQVAIYIWAGWAFAGAVVTAMLWNTTSRKVGVFPAVAPKLGALLTLSAASAAVIAGQQPLVVQGASVAGALCLLGAFATRWAALPAMIISAVGLLAVFASYIGRHAGVTWDQSAAMVMYGLTIITALMILVEKQGEQCESL
jgi:sugar phosphate permease